MRQRWFWFLALLFLAVWPLLSAQDATGSIAGNVFCSDGTPGRGAQVTIVPLDSLLSQKGGSESHGTVSRSGLTDFSGTYQLLSVRPGTYVVDAALAGYSDDLKLVLPALAAFSPEDRQKILATFPQVIVKPGGSAHKDLMLQRGAAISGRVSVDLGGIPGPISVTATRLPVGGTDAGSTGQIQQSSPFTQSSMMDDRGAYRIAGLPAGKYRISIRITEAYLGLSTSTSGGVHLHPERPGTAELTVYAPESLNVADARVIEVKEADEVTDADITVPTRMLHSIGGIVTDGDSPRLGVSVSIEGQGILGQHSDAITMDDGSYRFDLLPSGNYTLRVQPSGAATGASGTVSVQLEDTDVLDANIELHPKAAPEP
jgi:hypothetical protein